MATSREGWIHTAQTDCNPEFSTSHIFKRKYEKKVQHLPPLELHYDTPRSPTNKKWTDQELLSYRSVSNYLAHSESFQRATFANILEQRKERDKNEATRLLASFDSHYNMNLRFRKDSKLNRSSEIKHGPGARYYRFIGNENNPKHGKPCGLYKRHIQEYEERHIRELLKLPQKTKSRSEPYFFRKITELPHIETTLEDSPTTRSFVSAAEDSHHSIS